MDLSHYRVRYCRNSAAERIKKSPRWGNDEGVAATIGTIMALLVFLTFMGMFTNQFVPVWMSDNESTHMARALEQMQNLKSQIDGLVADYANSIVAPTPIFAPITLHAPGIPIFAEPTAGILSMVPETIYGMPSVNATFIATGFTLDSTTGGHTGGHISLYAPNRYYVEQRLTYEGGAIILTQTDGEFIIAGPQFSVTRAIAGTDVNRVVRLTQVSLLGQDAIVGGIGTKGVNAEMLYAGTTSFQGLPGGSDLEITIVTKHGNAWESYFKRNLNASLAGLEYGEDFFVSTVMYDFEGRLNDYYEVTVLIKDVNVFDHTRATVQVSIGEVAV